MSLYSQLTQSVRIQEENMHYTVLLPLLSNYPFYWLKKELTSHLGWGWGLGWVGWGWCGVGGAGGHKSKTCR